MMNGKRQEQTLTEMRVFVTNRAARVRGDFRCKISSSMKIIEREGGITICIDIFLCLAIFLQKVG